MVGKWGNGIQGGLPSLHPGRTCCSHSEPLLLMGIYFIPQEFEDRKKVVNHCFWISVLIVL